MIMPNRTRHWIYIGARAKGITVPAETKRTITAACERIIATVYIPLCLPVIRPTEFNYPVAIHGKWHGNRFIFMTRYRSGYPDNKGWEFDAPFTRLGYAGPDRYDLDFYRHTGRWWPISGALTLKEALHELENESLLQPHC
jgi:hypothetical protein